MLFLTKLVSIGSLGPIESFRALCSESSCSGKVGRFGSLNLGSAALGLLFSIMLGFREEFVEF